ncbi:MAG: hypothetical protein K2O70_00725, partial [Desulfovibrionaceae bacterium]|nr:hypothetical protein [Desulfovibrionaceae bacterium]
GAMKSAYSTFTGFDGHEEMLSNVIQAHPTLRNCVTEALVVSRDDSELEGRLKHALEDLGIGVAAEFALSVAGMLRASKASTQAARDKILVETTERLEELRSASGDGAEASATSPAPFADSLDNGFPEQSGKYAAAAMRTSEGRGAGESINVDMPSSSAMSSAPFPNSPDNGFLEQAGKDASTAGKYLSGAPENILKTVNEVIRSSENIDDVYARLTDDWNIRTHLLRDDNDLRVMEYIHSVMEPHTLKSRGPETITEVEEHVARMVELDMPNAARILRDAFTGDLKLTEAKAAVDLLKDRVSLTTLMLRNYARRYSVNPVSFSPQDWLDVATLKHNLDTCYLTERNIATESGRLLNFHKSKGAGTSVWVASKP